MLPRGAAPGGKSLGRAPTGGLRAIEGRRAWGASGVLGAEVETATRGVGGVALLFRSLLLSLLRGREVGGGGVVAHLIPPRRLLEGEDEVGGGIEFMSDCKICRIRTVEYFIALG